MGRLMKAIHAHWSRSALSIWLFGLGVLVMVANSGCSVLDTSVPKKPATTMSIDLPIERWQAVNGAQVLFVQNTGLPIVDIGISFRAGSAYDDDAYQRYHAEKTDAQAANKDVPRLALFTSSLLGEATADKNSQQISEAFERVGALFSTDVGQENASLSLRSLTGDALEASIDQLVEVLAEAQFTPADFQRSQAQLVNYLRYRQTQPQIQADNFYNAALFGGHDFGREKYGNTDLLERITLADIRRFYADYYTNKGMVIYITGDLSTAAAKKIADRLSLARNNDTHEPVTIAPITQATHGYVHKTFPAEQTQIHIGQVTEGRGHEDYAAFKLANDILGGGSSSRLYAEIREKKGLTYSVYSAYSPLLTQGKLRISLQTAKGQEAEAIAAIRQLIQTFVEEGVTQAELTQAKASYRMAFAQAFTSNRGINGFLGVLGRNDLGNDYLPDFMAKIEQADVAQVNRAIRAFIQPEKLLIMTLGDSPVSSLDSEASDAVQQGQE